MIWRREPYRRQRREGRVVKPNWRKVEFYDPTRPLPAGLLWYALETAPKREARISEWLENQGWFTLVPLEVRWRRERRQGGKREARSRYQVPVIPRIVLMGIPPRYSFPWYTVAGNLHITGVLGTLGEPQALKRGEAERLQASSAPLLLDRAAKPLRAGSRAQVRVAGYHRGRILEIASLTGKWADVKFWFEDGVKVVPRFKTEIKIEDLEAAE